MKSLTILTLFVLLITSFTACNYGNERKYNSMPTVNITAPSVEESKTFTPESFDFALARSKQLIGTDDVLTDEYLLLQAIYKRAFYQYLDKVTGLSDYERQLKNGKYNFAPLDKPEQNIYQRYGGFEWTYVYLRNNFHIERLTESDLSLLKNSDTASDLFNFVERTFKDVIAIHYESNADNFVAIYDVGALGSTSAPNNALVLGLSYEWDYDANGNIISVDAEKDKEAIVIDIGKAIELGLNKILDIPVVVFIQ
jgi:hypothetical protein